MLDNSEAQWTEVKNEDELQAFYLKILLALREAAKSAESWMADYDALKAKYEPLVAVPSGREGSEG